MPSVFNHRRYFQFILVVLTAVLISCEDYTDSEKYQRPEGLEGKLFEQLKTLPDNSQFASAIEKAGLDELFKSGYFTVLAPTNNALDEYMFSHQTSIEEMSQEELDRFIRFHILQAGWREDQLTGMTNSGWVDTTADYNNIPIANKRQTVFLADHRQVHVKQKGNTEYVVLDSTLATRSVTVIPDDRKYMSLYYDDFFRGNKLPLSDFSTFYDRIFEPGHIFYSNAKIISQAIPAENGFIYQIDRAVEPQMNLEEIMLSNPEGDYNNFLNWLYEFSSVKLNQTATDNQQQTESGAVLRDLYNMEFEILSINEESMYSKSQSIDENLSRHPTLFAPTNSAFDVFSNQFFTGQDGRIGFSAIPIEVKNLIIDEHSAEKSIYQSSIDNGFYNFNRHRIKGISDILKEKVYGSNGVFYGINESLIPRAMQSVAAPVLMLNDYYSLFYGMSFSNTIEILNPVEDYFEFFIVNEEFLDMDSTLIVTWTNVEDNVYQLYYYDDNPIRRARIKYDEFEMKRRILHQIVIEKPLGGRRKEFLRNALGNYVVYADYGTAQEDIYTVSPMEDPNIQVENRVQVDNGVVRSISGWFDINYTREFTAMGGVGKFTSLCTDLGIIDPANSRISTDVLAPGEYYTVFVPGDSAIEASGIESLPDKELERVLLYHFINNKLVFTDGRLSGGHYRTLAKDSTGEDLTIEISTFPDLIELKDGLGETLSIEEDGVNTNRMISYDIKEHYSSISNYDWYMTGLAHINLHKVLIPEGLLK